MPPRRRSEKAHFCYEAILEDLTRAESDVAIELREIEDESEEFLVDRCRDGFITLMEQESVERHLLQEAKNRIVGSVEQQYLKQRRNKAKYVLCGSDITAEIGSYIGENITMHNFIIAFTLSGDEPFVLNHVKRMLRESVVAEKITPDIAFPLLREWTRLGSTRISVSELCERLKLKDIYYTTRLYCNEYSFRGNDARDFTSHTLIGTGIFRGGVAWFIDYLKNPIPLVGFDSVHRWEVAIGKQEPREYSSQASDYTGYDERPFSVMYRSIKTRIRAT